MQDTHQWQCLEYLPPLVQWQQQGLRPVSLHQQCRAELPHPARPWAPDVVHLFGNICAPNEVEVFGFPDGTGGTVTDGGTGPAPKLSLSARHTHMPLACRSRRPKREPASMLSPLQALGAAQVQQNRVPLSIVLLDEDALLECVTVDLQAEVCRVETVVPDLEGPE